MEYKDYMTEKLFKVNKNDKIRRLFVRDAILFILSMVLGMVSFYIAKYVIINIAFTVVGALFFFNCGTIIGTWIRYAYEVKNK